MSTPTKAQLCALVSVWPAMYVEPVGAPNFSAKFSAHIFIMSRNTNPDTPSSHRMASGMSPCCSGARQSAPCPKLQNRESLTKSRARSKALQNPCRMMPQNIKTDQNRLNQSEMLRGYARGILAMPTESSYHPGGLPENFPGEAFNEKKQKNIKTLRLSLPTSASYGLDFIIQCLISKKNTRT